MVGLAALLATSKTAKCHKICRYRPIYNALKKFCTLNVMLCLSKVMLHPCLIIFVHRVALAALLSRPKSITMLISPFVISFRKFYKSNMLVCLSTSLLDVSITFVCVGTFLKSLENVRARQLGATINTTYCLFCFIDSTKIQQKYYITQLELV